MRIVSFILCWIVFASIGCAEKSPPGSTYEPSDEPTPTAKLEEPKVTAPPLGDPTVPEPGVRLFETMLKRGDSPMKLWIYLPAELPQGKMPCVLIAPAGTPLFVGMGLAEGDRAEHLPYVKAGFAVVSYELDGPANLEQASDAEIIAAATKFQQAHAGLDNAKAALDYALEQVPEIDPDRLYAVGHSSAATLALLVASQEPRIDACVAFAPVTNVYGRLQKAIPELDKAMPGFEKFIRWSSPNTHVKELTCPLLLFHAKDDNAVKIDESTTLAEQLKATNPNVKLITVPTGGHYESMLNLGIPQAIDWLKNLPKKE